MAHPKENEEDHKSFITKDFLETQLNCKIESFAVESGSKPGDNYMSVLYAISVKMVGNGTKFYLLKCYPSHPSRQKFLNKSNHFYNELCFYTIVSKELVNFQMELCSVAESEVIPLAIPLFAGGKAVDFSSDESLKERTFSPLDNFILMTDMRKAFGYKMADPRKGLDGEEVKLAFTELATFHALSWAYRNKVDENLLNKFCFLKRKSKDPKKSEMWLNILKENVGSAITAIISQKGKDNHLIPALSNFVDTKGKISLQYFSSQDEATEKTLQGSSSTYTDHWRVLCHGDCWTNNFLFQYNALSNTPERLVMLDFPLVKLGCPTLDLACLVYTSTRRAFRHSALLSCFQAYHDRFLEICNRLQVKPLPDFSVDAIQRRFDVSKHVGVVLALISLPLNLIESDSRAADLEKSSEQCNMGELLQDACNAAAESNQTLYQEWIVELVEDLYNEGFLSA